MKAIIVSLCIGLLTGAIVSKYYFSTTKIETVEKIVTKDRIITKERIVQAPDGTTTTDRTIDETKAENKQIDSKISIPAPAPSWKAGMGYDINRNYSLSLERRAFGPVFVGGSINNVGNALISVSIEF